MMASGSLVNDEVNDGIDVISLPSIDLRCFAADELLLVAQFSGHFPDASFRDIVIPKLDRAFFNESAGSRKQTYNNPDSIRHSNRGLRKPAATAVRIGYSNSNANTEAGVTSGAEVGESVVPYRVKEGTSTLGTRSVSAKTVVRVISQGKRKAPVKVEETRQILWKRGAGNEGSMLRSVGGSLEKEGLLDTSGSSQDSLETDSDWRRIIGVASPKITREDGRPSRRCTSGAGLAARRDPIYRSVNGVTGFSAERSASKTLRLSSGAYNDASEPEAKIARKNGKRTASGDDDAGSSEEDELERSRKRRRGGVMGGEGDPLLGQPEVDQRTEGVEGLVCKPAGVDDMMDRLEKMEGKWSSNDRTRKVVNAAGFPVGWTVRVGLRRNNGRTLFEYRDWRSPDGKVWHSFKDATTFLLSSLRHESSSEIVPLVKCSRTVSCDKSASVENKEATNVTVCPHQENTMRSSPVIANVDSLGFQSESPCEALDDTGGGKGLVHGVCADSQGVSEVHLDQLCGVAPLLQETPNITQSGTGQGVTINADVLAHRQKVFVMTEVSKPQPAPRMHCRTRNTCKGSIDEQCCQDKLFEESDSMKIRKSFYLDSTSQGMECTGRCALSSDRDAQCCVLVSNGGAKHDCNSCGTIFPTLLKLRQHLSKVNRVRYFRCEVCGRQFSSATLLLGHRVALGHPRVTRLTSGSKSYQALVSDDVGNSSTSEMLNIVFGLLSDTTRAPICGADHPSAAESLSKRSSENPKETLENKKEGCKQGTGKRCNVSGMFECSCCHETFRHHSKYKGQLNTHSIHSKRALMPRSLSGTDWKRLSSGVDPKADLGHLVGVKTGSEAGHRCSGCAKQAITKSVFWKLLDDSSSFGDTERRSVQFQAEATVGPPPPPYANKKA